MSKPELIKKSGWAFIAGSLAFITILTGADDIAIPGSVVSAILLAVGLLGLRARYGEHVGGFGRNILLLGASGPILLVIVIAIGFSGNLTEAQITKGLWILLFGGPAITLLGLTLFGLVALRSKPMPRLNWLPAFTGIWYPALYFIFSVHIFLNNRVLPDQYLPIGGFIVVIQFLALCILGAVLIDDSSKELATADQGSCTEREDQMNTNQKSIGIGFWLAWVLASTLGFGLGGVLSTAILVAARVPEGIVFPILFGVIFGAISTLPQWMVIRRQAPEAGLWVPFSAVAFMLAVPMAAGMDPNSPDFNPLFILAGIYGLLGGFLQGLILEKRGVPIGWWIVASVIGGTLGCTLNGSTFGLGLGLVTGGVLFWFLRNPKIESQDEAAMQGTR